jgi:selenocysteine-specific translation elongation factor
MRKAGIRIAMVLDSNRKDAVSRGVVMLSQFSDCFVHLETRFNVVEKRHHLQINFHFTKSSPITAETNVDFLRERKKQGRVVIKIGGIICSGKKLR